MTTKLHSPAILPLAAALAFALAAHARADAVPDGLSATITVTSCADSGAGTLRQAIADAPDGAFIDLGHLPCADSTITLTSGALVIDDDRGLLIASYLRPSIATDARARADGFATATIASAGNDRIIDHTGSGYLGLLGLTLRDGHAQGPGGCVRTNGRIYGASLTVTGCTATGVNFGEGAGGGLFVAGDLDLVRSVISGNAAEGDSFVRGGGIDVGGRFTMDATTLSDNTAIDASDAFGVGGGLYALGDATISYSTISGNRATTVGGADLFGADGVATLRIVDSTISGNQGEGIGGVLALQSPVSIASSTIAFNTATAAGGIGGLALGNDSTLQSTLAAHNTSPAGGSDVGAQCGVFPGCTRAVAGADNLVMATIGVIFPAGTLTADPLLQPLADNGGLTRTHALAAQSPAIDHGNATGAGAGALDHDQRYLDYVRVVGAAADIGAFERGAGPDRVFADGFDCAAPPAHRGGAEPAVECRPAAAQR